jgi:dTDP-4-amino-4,6-dideoxy-D-galactose acyltransferase
MLIENSSLQPTCNLLVWDSNFWGFPVGRLDSSLLREGMERSVMDWCQREKIRCLYFAADGTDAETLQRAFEAGFQFVDVRADLECDAPKWGLSSTANLKVRAVSGETLGILQKIARNAHFNTRFFKDLNFDRLRCQSLYEKWIERDFQTGRIFGFFPKNSADLRGYVTLTKESAQIARIGLIAVEESLRGLGGGRMLLDAAMAASVEMGARKIHVATQGTNVAALKLYEKAGFRVCDVKIWFHRWFVV